MAKRGHDEITALPPVWGTLFQVAPWATAVQGACSVACDIPWPHLSEVGRCGALLDVLLQWAHGGADVRAAAEHQLVAGQRPWSTWESVAVDRLDRHRELAIPTCVTDWLVALVLYSRGRGAVPWWIADEARTASWRMYPLVRDCVPDPQTDEGELGFFPWRADVAQYIGEVAKAHAVEQELVRWLNEAQEAGAAAYPSLSSAAASDALLLLPLQHQPSQPRAALQCSHVRDRLVRRAVCLDDDTDVETAGRAKRRPHTIVSALLPVWSAAARLDDWRMVHRLLQRRDLRDELAHMENHPTSAVHWMAYALRHRSPVLLRLMAANGSVPPRNAASLAVTEAGRHDADVRVVWELVRVAVRLDARSKWSFDEWVDRSVPGGSPGDEDWGPNESVGKALAAWTCAVMQNEADEGQQQAWACAVDTIDQYLHGEDTADDSATDGCPATGTPDECL